MQVLYSHISRASSLQESKYCSCVSTALRPTYVCKDYVQEGTLHARELGFFALAPDL